MVLLSGRVVASGTAEEVLTLENLTAAYGPNLLHVEERGSSSTIRPTGPCREGTITGIDRSESASVSS